MRTDPVPSRRDVLLGAAGAATLALGACSNDPIRAVVRSGAAPTDGQTSAPTLAPTSGDEGQPLQSGATPATTPSPTLSQAATVTWTPSEPLPAASTSSEVLVLLSPHPDDETLSMGVLAANAVQQRHRVVVACLTDGRATGATEQIAKRLGRPFTRDDVAAARIGELRRAAAQLGVAADDVVLAHLDGDGTQDGSRLTQAEAAGVIAVLAQRFPNATYVTMSYAAERHPDHLDAGRALWQAVQDGVVRSARFAVSRLWLDLPAPGRTAVLPATAAAGRRVRDAGLAYSRWDPAHHEYAVGWTSVHEQFVALEGDPRDHVHPWTPTLLQPPAQTPGPSPLAATSQPTPTPSTTRRP